MELIRSNPLDRITLVLNQTFNGVSISNAAAEQQNIIEDHRLLQDTYTPLGGPANHHEMAGEAQSFTRLADEIVEKKPTSELPLSEKHKRPNMKLKCANKLHNDFSNSSSKKFMVSPMAQTAS